RVESARRLPRFLPSLSARAHYLAVRCYTPFPREPEYRESTHASHGPEQFGPRPPPPRQFERRDSLSQSAPRVLLDSPPAILFPDRRPPPSMVDPAARSPPRGTAILGARRSPASARSCASFVLPLPLRLPRSR